MRHLILIYSCIAFFSSLTYAQSDTCLLHTQIGISFPPVADQMQRDFAQPHLDSLRIKKIRFGEDWALREPTQGNFNWSPLDQRIQWANTNGYEVLLTIQSRGPSWACGLQNNQSCVFTDNNDFKIYIDSLLQRYPNQIDKIQFGNEWQSQFWYVGHAQAFIDANNVLYQSVQNHSPSTQVVLGGFTTISLRFLAGCNGYVNMFYDDDGILYDSTFLSNNCNSPEIIAVKNRIDSILKFAQYDIIDLHLYDDVEQWGAYYANFTDTITTPIIVSEFGGPNLNLEPYSDAYQADQLFRYIKTLDSLEITEAYFFKLVEGTANPAHAASGLIDDTTLAEKAAYYLVKSFNDCQSLSFQFNHLEQIKFYPNPAHQWVSLEFDSNHLPAEKLTIYNASGQLVYDTQNINDQYIVLDTDAFSSGYYFVKLWSDGQVIASGKLIIY